MSEGAIAELAPPGQPVRIQAPADREGSDFIACAWAAGCTVLGLILFALALPRVLGGASGAVLVWTCAGAAYAALGAFALVWRLNSRSDPDPKLSARRNASGAVLAALVIPLLIVAGLRIRGDAAADTSGPGTQLIEGRVESVWLRGRDTGVYALDIKLTGQAQTFTYRCRSFWSRRSYGPHRCDAPAQLRAFADAPPPARARLREREGEIVMLEADGQTIVDLDRERGHAAAEMNWFEIAVGGLAAWAAWVAFANLRRFLRAVRLRPARDALIS